jgi:NADH dehydrogenase
MHTFMSGSATAHRSQPVRTGRAPGAHKRRAGAGRPPHVVIVGGGFAGLAAAQALASAPVDVTLIDRCNHHLFQPLLYQVATAALSPSDIASPIRSVLRDQANATVLLDEVIDVDTEWRRVITRDGAEATYDYLILATGAEYSYFGHDDDWARYAVGLKSLEDATEIRARLLMAFEKAEAECDAASQNKMLTFVLIGAGPTGVEMAGAVAELAKATLARDFRRIDPRNARIILIEAGPRVLPGFRPELSAYAHSTLDRMGVDIRLHTTIDDITSDGVIARGRVIEAATIVWCAGVKATPAGRWLNRATSRNGAIEVKADLSIPGLPEVFAIGDLAHRLGADGKPLPGLAAVAKQEGNYVGTVIAANVRNSPLPAAFSYRDRGTLATIGRSAAVADFGWLRLKGRTAWLLWGFVHILFLIGFRNRALVFINWVWAWLTSTRGARLIIAGRAHKQR